MAETLGDVGGEADVGGSEAMLAVNVAIMHPADGLHFSGLAVAVIPNKLSHGPGLEGRPMSTEAWKMANEDADQLALALPEARQQLTFFFGSQQVRGKDRGGRGLRCGGCSGSTSGVRRTLAHAALSLHSLPSPNDFTVLQPRQQ